MTNAQESQEFPIIPEDLGNPEEEVNPDLAERIKVRAYEYYHRRGHVDGFDLEDWLTAEQEIMEEEWIRLITAIANARHSTKVIPFAQRDRMREVTQT